MAKPYTKEFILPSGIHITSVVLDKDDFDKLIDMIETTNVDNALGINQEQINILRKSKVLPVMKRGPHSEPLFKRYNVATEYMSAIVRGQGTAIMEAINERN